MCNHPMFPCELCGMGNTSPRLFPSFAKSSWHGSGILVVMNQVSIGDATGKEGPHGLRPDKELYLFRDRKFVQAMYYSSLISYCTKKSAIGRVWGFAALCF